MKLLTHKKSLSLGIGLLLLTGILLLQQFAPGLYSQWSQLLSQEQPGLYTVTAVADGDTFTAERDGRTYRIRTIGVDTPETHHPEKPVQCFGEEATKYARSLLEGQKVRLEADVISDNQDRYQRLLRYVYLPESDNLFYNQHIVEEGYGVSYRSFLHSKLEAFERSEHRARQAQRGLWKACDPELNDYGTYETEAAR